jgi:succinate dehydrogenase/fumarate reductase flavoprotein subunit
MTRWSDIVVFLVALVFLAGCSYSLPSPLQTSVDDLVQQTAGVQQVVRSIKAKAEAGEVNSNDLDNVQRRYNELVRTHDAWRSQVQHVINNEIDYFENDEQYKNAVLKLQNASDEFAKAADAALGGSTHTTVPDWPAEARSLIVNAYNDRKHKKAAVLIHDQLRIARWDEI